MGARLIISSLMLCSLMLGACEPSKPQVVTSTAQQVESASPERLAQAMIFKSGKEIVASLTVQEISKVAPLQVWTAFDPYYQKPKTWRAFELAPALELAFGAEFESLKERELIMRATDGYQVPISGQDLLRPGAFVAIEDMDTPDWELIGPQQAHPGPFYLVWKGADQQDQEVFPRPWQLAEIEVADFEQLYPKTVPVGQEAGSLAGQGYELFKAQCSRCHAMNRQGGRVGPELNVPRNITEYRPEDQIRAYIKNPLAFRYGNMPEFPHLTEKDIDGLIAYLTVMRDQKHDPAKLEKP